MTASVLSLMEMDYVLGGIRILKRRFWFGFRVQAKIGSYWYDIVPEMLPLINSELARRLAKKEKEPDRFTGLRILQKPFGVRIQFLWCFLRRKSFGVRIPFWAPGTPEPETNFELVESDTWNEMKSAYLPEANRLLEDLFNAA